MKAKAKAVPAGEFKAKCLAILDRVEETREPCVVTKRGRPVAWVIPVPQRPQRPLRGSVQYRGDIVGPLDDEWAIDR